MSINIINEFVDDILSEVGIDTNVPSYPKLRQSLYDRVVMRIFLELLNLLTPEQASQLRSTINQDSMDAEQVFSDFTTQIPQCREHLLTIMAAIRIELINDLQPLSKRSH